MSFYWFTLLEMGEIVEINAWERYFCDCVFFLWLRELTLSQTQTRKTTKKNYVKEQDKTQSMNKSWGGSEAE
jgi:hypothetical protein